MNVLSTIAGKPLRDRIRNRQIRETYIVEDIIKWGETRRKYWNNHIKRMHTNRLVRIAISKGKIAKPTCSRKTSEETI